MGLPLRGPKVKSKHLKLLNLCKICKCPLHPPAPPIEHASVQLYDYNNNKYYIVTVQILFNYVNFFFFFLRNMYAIIGAIITPLPTPHPPIHPILVL